MWYALTMNKYNVRIPYMTYLSGSSVPVMGSCFSTIESIGNPEQMMLSEFSYLEITQGLLDKINLPRDKVMFLAPYFTLH